MGKYGQPEIVMLENIEFDLADLSAFVESVEYKDDIGVLFPGCCSKIGIGLTVFFLWFKDTA